ncbi:MAG TPA: hypothetical protein VFJ53_08655, partial [Solirubrobacterales bacterium]|nr:hypothetical protein [Solirubrobacterales bacterium]
WVPVYVKRHLIQPFDLALQDGRIVVSGLDENYDVRKDYELGFTVLRYRGDGSIDRSFGRHGLVVKPRGPFSGAYAILNQGPRVVVAGGGEDEWKEGDKWYSSFLLLTRYLPG